MSLSEALNIGLSFAKMYCQSPIFEYNSKKMESENLFKKALLDRFDGALKLLAGRR